jgi:hypothetical protein
MRYPLKNGLPGKASAATDLERLWRSAVADGDFPEQDARSERGGQVPVAQDLGHGLQGKIDLTKEPVEKAALVIGHRDNSIQYPFIYSAPPRTRCVVRVFGHSYVLIFNRKLCPSADVTRP